MVVCMCAVLSKAHSFYIVAPSAPHLPNSNKITSHNCDIQTLKGRYYFFLTVLLLVHFKKQCKIQMLNLNFAN